MVVQIVSHDLCPILSYLPHLLQATAIRKDHFGMRLVARHRTLSGQRATNVYLPHTPIRDWACRASNTEDEREADSMLQWFPQALSRKRVGAFYLDPANLSSRVPNLKTPLHNCPSRDFLAKTKGKRRKPKRRNATRLQGLSADIHPVRPLLALLFESTLYNKEDRFQMERCANMCEHVI